MSKQLDRRAAEREARKLAYQQFRQQPPQTTASESVPNAISEAQLAANRANAQFSSGAITPAGQARSSMNALKHGLTGKAVLLPGEDATEYQHEFDSHFQAHKPATEDELRLVQSILDCHWRLSRIQHLETAILLKGHIEFASKYEDRSPLERAHLIQAEAYLKYERQIRNLNIQEARLRRTLDKNRLELALLQANRRRQELADLQIQRQAERAVPSANGFEFSTPSNPKPIAAESAGHL